MTQEEIEVYRTGWDAAMKSAADYLEGLDQTITWYPHQVAAVIRALATQFSRRP